MTCDPFLSRTQVIFDRITTTGVCHYIDIDIEAGVVFVLDIA